MDGDFVPKRNGRKLMNIEKLIFPNEYLVSNWGECVAFTVLHFLVSGTLLHTHKDTQTSLSEIQFPGIWGCKCSNIALYKSPINLLYESQS